MENGKNIRHFFKLKLKSPTSLALKTNFQDLTGDVFEAVEFFNQKFAGIKEIILPNVEFSIINLVLIFFDEPKDQVTAKELTVFSRYLYNDKEWIRFSRERTKLFIPVKISLFTDQELLNYINSLDKDPRDYMRYFDQKDFESLRGIRREPNNDETQDILPEENKFELFAMNAKYAPEPEWSSLPKDYESKSLDMSEEQMVAIIKYLFATKDIGGATSISKKNQALKEIKNILLPWVFND